MGTVVRSIVLCLMFSPLVAVAQAKLAVKPAAKPVVKEEAQTPQEQLIAQLIQQIGTPQFRAKLDVGVGKEKGPNVIIVRGLVPFRGDIAQFFSPQSENSDANKARPELNMKLKGLIAVVDLNSNGNQLTLNVHFQNMQGGRVPVNITLDSELAMLLHWRIDSLSITSTGLNAEEKEIVLNATCSLKQNLPDLMTGKVEWIGTPCEIKGRYVKADKQFIGRFKYDSLGQQD